MICPNCELVNPPTSIRCDCGYDFQTHRIEKPYVLPSVGQPRTRWGWRAVKDWRGWLKATAIGAATGTAIGLLAFRILTLRQYPGMGSVLFLLVPIGAGFSIAMVARRPNTETAAAVLSLVASLVLLIAFGAEGVLCAVLALPIIVAGLLVGIGIGLLLSRLVARRTKTPTTTTGMLLLLAPVLIFAGEKIETPMLKFPRTEVIQTAVNVNGSPEQVWREILSIDNIKASKPFLMYVGLPIPQRCTIQGRGVGAKRICYFNVGYIEEMVTAWNPPYYIGLSIDRTHMPGRHWLGFESADYSLEWLGDRTRLTRRTTVFSYLRPAWYWRSFERLGVEAEHSYILHDVVLRTKH
jgi:hypothetical protein